MRIALNSEMKQIGVFVDVGGTEARQVPIDEVMSPSDLREELLAQALRELSGFEDQYATLNQMNSVLQALAAFGNKKAGAGD